MGRVRCTTEYLLIAPEGASARQWNVVESFDPGLLVGKRDADTPRSHRSLRVVWLIRTVTKPGVMLTHALADMGC